MEKGILGITIFVTISILFSLIAHFILKKYWVAICSSVILSVAVFQIAEYIHLGRLDSYFIVAGVTSGLLALAISSAIGILLKCTK
jgi:hypothetical protein